MRRREFVAGVGLISTIGIGGCLEDGPAGSDSDMSPPNPKDDGNGQNGDGSSNDDSSQKGESDSDESRSSQQNDDSSNDQDSQSDDTNEEHEADAQNDEPSQDDEQPSDGDQQSGDESPSDDEEPSQNETEEPQNETGNETEDETNETGEPVNESEPSENETGNETEEPYQGISVEIQSAVWSKDSETGTISVRTSVQNRGQPTEAYVQVEVNDTEGGTKTVSSNTVSLGAGESHTFTTTVEGLKFAQPIIKNVEVGLYANGSLEDSIRATNASSMPRLVFGMVRGLLG